jgi:hypothetical protein
MKSWLPIIIPSSLILILIGIDHWWMKDQFFHPYKWLFLIFFVFLGYISRQIHIYSQLDDQTKSSLYYFSTMIIRLLLGVVLISILLFREEESKWLLVVNFFIFYLLYFVFEIYYLLANLRANIKSK